MLNVESFLWINPFLEIVSASVDEEDLWEMKPAGVDKVDSQFSMD